MLFQIQQNNLSRPKRSKRNNKKVAQTTYLHRQKNMSSWSLSVCHNLPSNCGHSMKHETAKLITGSDLWMIYARHAAEKCCFLWSLYPRCIAKERTTMTLHTYVYIYVYIYIYVNAIWTMRTKLKIDQCQKKVGAFAPWPIFDPSMFSRWTCEVGKSSTKWVMASSSQTCKISKW